MSIARQLRRIARAHAVRLGTPDQPATREDLLATIAPGQLGWDEGAINADAAGHDRCPSAFRTDYYAAYESAANAHARRLAEAL